MCFSRHNDKIGDEHLMSVVFNCRFYDLIVSDESSVVLKQEALKILLGIAYFIVLTSIEVHSSRRCN